MENKTDLSAEGLKKRRTEHIIATAAELFLENGIESIKMTDIADESGIGVATLYRYFGTKTKIALAAMTFLWADLKKLFDGRFSEIERGSADGITELEQLIKMFSELYVSHKDFMRLVGEFDRFVLHEELDRDDLMEYENSIVDFYPVLERAFRKGIKDKTVRQDVDFRLFYQSFTHALTEMCKKFIGGEILPSDDFSDAEKELALIADSAVYYIRKQG
ncbi:MAG: TetR/AcrR family transcriptional regulator [Oscillospiraceae bacterium]|nr:TetR/AcrR family transcriptional regulator [Oscillospiraceae bacterium]